MTMLAKTSLIALLALTAAPHADAQTYEEYEAEVAKREAAQSEVGGGE